QDADCGENQSCVDSRCFPTICVLGEGGIDTIQIAIDEGCDVLHVPAGTHAESGVTLNRDLVIIGEGAEHSILDAAASGRHFDLESGVSSLQLQGLTLINGVGERGGSIGSDANAYDVKLELSDVQFIGNSASLEGGAIFLDRGELIGVGSRF